ncbi:MULTISPECIES: portal protein [Paraburkholderia]|uniref:portal protein n=1 Tax=Paraburkholderia TaxID=1822464 RepID=UPI0022529772|nr:MULTISPECIES: portal protein [Paraburkholderia]MCX4154988.1 portal protein [Paraburkholderia aspalathi]MDN7164398.1 portal protein [Paraburkholderia sp. SECH2]MDQ6392883.1 portal protein [Paraburkholderia aspalathi]
MTETPGQIDPKAEEILRLHSNLAARRGIWEGHWREVAERVRPQQNIFQQQRPDGDKRNERIFDATAPLALPKFAAAVISMSFPATQAYHKLAAHNMALADNTSVRRYLEEVNDILFKVRYAPHSNFQSQSGEVVLDIGAFGTGVLYVDDVPGIGIRYKSFPLAECWIAEDAHGRIDTLVRKFEWTAHQAVTEWGYANCPREVQEAFEKQFQTKFWFMHAVQPNRNRLFGRRDYKGMAFESCYLSVNTRQIISEGGYRTFPFCVPRFETAPREVYGRSPAMSVLPDIKMLNEMAKTIIRAAQNVVAPPIMLTDDASLQAFNVRSNALNYGYVDSNGRAAAIPFESKAQVNIGLDMMNQRREVINDAFFVTLFRILVQEPQITATEAMLRAQEKGQLLAPTMGRIQAELLGPLVEREIDILSMAGVLPPMPPELIRAGGSFKIEYQSPLNQAQRAGVGVSILQTIQSIAPLAQIDPTVMQIFDLDKAARLIAEVGGVPESVIRTDEELVKLKEQAATAAQAQQLLAAAPVAASAAKDFAQAQATAGNNQQAPQLGLPTGAPA